MSKKLIVGLTGGIGSGKSTVAKQFEKLKIAVIDADKITRELVLPKTLFLKKIIKKFGVEFLNKDGFLNRKKLREKIFECNHAKKWLENLLHTEVIKIMKSRALKAKSPYCVLVIPLLTENILNKKSPLYKKLTFIDRILVVDSTKKLQLNHSIKRDISTKKQILKIMKSQSSRAQRLKKADDIIKNIGTLTHLKKQVKEMHNFYLTISKKIGSN